MTATAAATSTELTTVPDIRVVAGAATDEELAAVIVGLAYALRPKDGRSPIGGAGRPETPAGSDGPCRLTWRHEPRTTTLYRHGYGLIRPSRIAEAVR